MTTVGEKRFADAKLEQPDRESNESLSKEELRFAAMKEHALGLSEKVHDLCNRFRKRLINRQVLGCRYIIAKFYYDMAWLNYEYYNSCGIKNNLLSVRHYLMKCIDQFDYQQTVAGNISIVKDAKYLLNLDSDFYIRSDLDEKALPQIAGNAIVVVKNPNSSEYSICFVENHGWLKINNTLRRVSFQDLNLNGINTVDKIGLVHKTEQNRNIIEDISVKAHLRCGRISVNTRYYQLKRRRNKLEKRLSEDISRANEKASTDIGSEEHILKILSDIIECSLEIGLVNEAQHYIEQLKSARKEAFSTKIKDYQLRTNLIIHLRTIIESEISLLLQLEDDVKYFVIEKPKNSTDYNTAVEKWKDIYKESNSRSILFILNPTVNDILWESHFEIPDKTKIVFNLTINKNSSLHNFLQHVNNNGFIKSFNSELLDMLMDTDVFLDIDDNLDFKKTFFTNKQFNLQSKRTKIICFSQLLETAYQFIGHHFLAQHYHRVFCHFSEERKKLRQKMFSFFDVQKHSAIDLKAQSNNNQNDLFPISLFPCQSGASVKKLNDTIQKNDFFTEILPYIDEIKNVQRSLTCVYDIDWLLCEDKNEQDAMLIRWHEDYKRFQEQNLYQKKYLFLLVQCDFYFFSNVDRNFLPQIKGNAVVLSGIEGTSDFTAYFVKDSLWMKYPTTKNLKSIIIKNIDLTNIPVNNNTGLINKKEFKSKKDKGQIEKVAAEKSLNRWYFYGETPLGQISEGFIDQKEELKVLTGLLKDITYRNGVIERSDTLLHKETEILLSLSGIFDVDMESLVQQYFIKSTSKIDYEKQCLLRKGVIIYDLQRIDEGNRLKHEIKSDKNRSFSCIVRLSSKRYIALFVEKQTKYNASYSSRYIYVLDSAIPETNWSVLNWFSGLMENCIYEVRPIHCPKQRQMSEDSFLHAYFNAAACQWASNNGHWVFLKRNFHRQKFSTEENIEKLKKWFIETNERMPILDNPEVSCSVNSTIEVIEKFKSQLQNILKRYLSSQEPQQVERCVERLSERFENIRSFDQIVEFVKEIVADEVIEFEECIRPIQNERKTLDEEQKEALEIYSVVDMMFEILRQVSLDLLAFQEKLTPISERFEDNLHHAILLNLFEQRSFVVQNKYPECSQKIKLMCEQSCGIDGGFKYSSSFDNFLSSLKTFLVKENNFSNAHELILQCENLGRTLSEGNIKDSVATNTMAKKSLDRIRSFLDRFKGVEDSLKEFHGIFCNLLPLCYELLPISEIHKQLKEDVYKEICHQEQNFDNIKKCTMGLYQKATPCPTDAEEKLNRIFESLNSCKDQNDERAIHYIGAYLRQSMMIRIDDYMKNLATFRHQSLNSIETFEKSLHEFLLNSVRKSIKDRKVGHSLANDSSGCFSSNAFNYEEKKSEYEKMIHLLEDEKTTIPEEVIKNLKTQFDNKIHSHFVYLEVKVKDLTNMLQRFAKIEKYLPKFSDTFRKCLKNRYDHLSEQEVFSVNGQVTREITERLKPSKTFNDILEIAKVFEDKELSGIVTRCQKFATDNDEKASTELSQCLRECIIDTVEAYSESLIDFRYQARVAFNRFEKEFYDFLSTYDSIKDKDLRSWLKQRLQQLTVLDYNSENSYDEYKRLYNEIINYLSSRNCAFVSNVLDIFNEEHSLKPLLKQKVSTLKTLLNGYLNWYTVEIKPDHEYTVIQITTCSAILSDIIDVLVSEYSDCRCPNNEIRIINSDKLYIDTDLASSDYSGVNIVIVSPHQELVGKKSKFEIKTDGKDAEDLWENNPAQCAHGTDQNGNGNKGEDGSDGKEGKSAGHVYVVGNKLPPTEVSAVGGQGGQGQNGGNGAPASDGTDGVDADMRRLNDYIENPPYWKGNAWSYRYRRLGTDGTPGGKGGDAGSGGYHGESGDCGIVKRLSLNKILPQGKEHSFERKPNNGDGEPGKPGEAGKHGRDGLDCVLISNYVGVWSSAVNERRETDSKRGRIASAFRCKRDEKKTYNNYTMLPFDYDKDNCRFTSKYLDKNANHGARSSNKHKNQESVKKIHAINYQHVFQETERFFDQYCNPEQSVTYQHWTAKSLNEFLEKMAAETGRPPYKVHTLPDIGHDAKQLLILKERFSQIVDAGNQRLKAEKLNSNEMNIGVLSLSQDILSQYNEYLKQHQTLYQQLQDEIQRVDINQLGTGLEIRSAEIENFKRSVNRIINEHRFSQQIATVQRRMEVLVESPKEDLSKLISDRQNVKIVQNTLVKQEWRKFELRNCIVDSKLIQNFNLSPEETSLLTMGDNFLEKIRTILSSDESHTIDLNDTSNFIHTYLYNLQQMNNGTNSLEKLTKQRETLSKLFMEFSSLENTSTLDLLIAFHKGLHQEYLRNYWLTWTKKILECAHEFPLDSGKEMKNSVLQISRTIKIADDYQLKIISAQLENSLISREFELFNFDENSNSHKNASLIQSMKNCNKNCNKDNLIEVFNTFADSSFFDELEALLANGERLNMVKNFLFNFYKNLRLLNILKTNFNSLNNPMAKIEEVLLKHPRSYLYDLFFHFSIAVERIKKENPIPGDRDNELDEIEKSCDMRRLLKLHSSKQHEEVKITYTLEQRIDAFNTLYDPDLAEEILETLCSSISEISRVPENKVVGFITWITNNRRKFDNELMRKIVHIVGNIRGEALNENIQYALQFLRIIFDHKITKVDFEKECESINGMFEEEQNLLKKISSFQEICDRFQLVSNPNCDLEKVFAFRDLVVEFNDLEKPTDWHGLPDDILVSIRDKCSGILGKIYIENRHELRNKLINLALNRSSPAPSTEDKEQMTKAIEHYIESLITTTNYLETAEKTINQQLLKNKVSMEKKTLLAILDKLFSDLEYLHDDIRVLIAKKLNQINMNSNDNLPRIIETYKELVKESKFCLFAYEIKQNLVNKITIRLRNRKDLNTLLEGKLEKSFNHCLSPNYTGPDLPDVTGEIISIFNLCELVPDVKMDESLKNVIDKFNNIENQNLKEQVLTVLSNDYLTSNNQLRMFKQNIEKFYQNQNKLTKEKLKDYETIVSFSYQELNEKSKFIEEIYQMFYDYCKKAASEWKTHYRNILNLMKLITIVHRDRTNANEVNIDHAKFQVVLLHTLFQEGNPLGVINSELIGFLDWLLEILFKYDSVAKTEEINIEFEHVRRLETLCSSVKTYCEGSSRKERYPYDYFNQAIDTVYSEMKVVYIEKYIRVLFRKHSNAKWLEIVIYFSEFFERDNEELLKLIKRKEDNLDTNEVNGIQEFIFNKIVIVQEEKLKQFYSFLSTKTEKVKEAFEQFHGLLTREKDSFNEKHPYEVLTFNNLIDTFNGRLERDRGLLIDEDIFVKVQNCLACFEDASIAIEMLSSSTQKDWLKVLLIEHVIEKFCLIFSENNRIEDLRNQLMSVKENLLLLFNNKLVTEYIDQISQSINSKNDCPLQTYRKITQEKFLRIVGLMTRISVTKEELDQLSDASLSVWDTILHEIDFSRLFTEEMSKLGVNVNENSVEKALVFLNRIRTELGIENHGIFVNFFQDICKKIDEAKTNDIKPLSNLLKAIYHRVISFEQGRDIVLKCAYNDWLNDELGKPKFPDGPIDNQSDRSVEDIIKLMMDGQKSKPNTLSKDILIKISEQANSFKDLAKQKVAFEGDEKSKINREIQDILNLKSYQANPSEYVRSHLNNIIPLILYAWSVANKPQFPKDTQIVALLLFISSEDKGLLEQIRTGEGKTLIVGLTAAFLALCGNAVHVVSSNRDLAIEGEQKCRTFFQLLQLESGHICHESDEANHQSYQLNLYTTQGSIVYGEVGGFQRDILESEFNNKKIFNERYAKREKCLIVDEVDNMCLDRARHVLYLSHEIQSLKWLETLFINIWVAVLRVDIDSTDDVSEHIKDISEFMISAVKRQMIFVPKYLHDYVDYKMNRWIDSAFQARIMREDDHFVLDIPKTDSPTAQRHRAIIVLDKDTGTEQYSTRWSNGLAQFLELKYRRKLSVESLKAVFISNKAFFQKYKHSLYGLTGTLGSQNSQSFLSDLYNVQFVDLPTSRQKHYYQIPSRVAFEYSDWLDLIAKETIENAKKRPVLIICENVEATENIWAQLIRYGVAPHTIAKYRRDGDNVEERFRKQFATTGDIIIATNKGGRGTDIHVDPKMNVVGGMHVILSYLPENVRIQEQAFGRTARNGAAGTGQFILQVDKSVYEKMYDLSQCPRDIQQTKLADLSDVIIEREKIYRDNKEAARLSELKTKSILRLEVEEELFDKFNTFKRDITDNVFKKLFENKTDEYKEKFVAVLQNVLKDRWAFWLDKAKEKIDNIETSGQKNLLLKEYDSSFVQELEGTLKVSNFHDLLRSFIKKPEEAIQVGQVCLSVEEFSTAKLLFEEAAKEDSSGYSYIGIAFCLIKLNSGENVKKNSRRELKKAIRCLESIKRNLMGNLKIAEMLPQSASAEILQKVSSKENLYEDQIRGKLEVIGLHLHYLYYAVGQVVEPYDFILHPNEGEELTKEKRKKGEELYKILVDGELIQGNQLRKVFQNKEERRNMEQEIRDNIDPSVAESIIDLLKKTTFQQKDFENIVCYNEQLWNALKMQNSEDASILDKGRLERVLPQEYEKLWKGLENAIDPSNVDISLFEISSDRKNFKTYLEENNMLIKTKRAKIEQLDPNSLKFEGEYEKYAKVIFNDNGHEKSNLNKFLEDLKAQIISQGGEYIYQKDLPYSTKEDEAKKILMFLQDKNIIKSGGLAKYKYGDTSEDIHKLLTKILPDEFKNDQELIESKILSLQGDIRSSKEDLKATLKDFVDLKDQEKVPSELKFFEGLGLNKFLIIEEDKSWWDWNAFAVAMIGLAQIIGGSVLIALGCVNIGSTLIAEGINDMVYATMAGLSGTFSWKDWAIQKSISFSISLLTCGIGKLATMGKTVAAVGSISRSAIFVQVAKQAIYQFAKTSLTMIVDEKVREIMKELLVVKIVKFIEDNLLKEIYDRIHVTVERVYSTSKDDKEFEKAFDQLKENIKVTLGKSVFNQQFNNIRVQIVSAFKNTSETVLKSLSNSSSKYVKLAASTIEIGLLVDRIMNVIQTSLRLKNAFEAFVTIFVNSLILENDSNQKTRQSDTEIIRTRYNQLISVIKAYLTKVLTQGLITILIKVLNGELIRKAKDTVKFVKNMINEEFNQKNPIDTLKCCKQSISERWRNLAFVERPSETENAHQEMQAKIRRDDIQNNIQNPKQKFENMTNQTDDNNRPLGRADIRMLADKKCRDIVVYNKDTGEIETIRPTGLRKIPAFFKEAAEINYKKDEGEYIGHFTNAKAGERYKQLNGRNDCLIIAYHESLGHTVNERLIQSERKEFGRDVEENQKTYNRYKNDENSNERTEILGGRQKTERHFDETEEGKYNAAKTLPDNDVKYEQAK